MEGFDSQQVEDHRVGQPELGLEGGGFTLGHTWGGGGLTFSL